MTDRPPGLPAWFEPLLTNVASARTEDFTTLRAPAGNAGRASAVLVLLGEGSGPGAPSGSASGPGSAEGLRTGAGGGAGSGADSGAGGGASSGTGSGAGGGAGSSVGWGTHSGAGTGVDTGVGLRTGAGLGGGADSAGGSGRAGSGVAGGAGLGVAGGAGLGVAGGAGLGVGVRTGVGTGNGIGSGSGVSSGAGDGWVGPDLLVLQRAASMRNHAGQPAFPGGASDPEDGDDRVVTALREANEEVGLDPATATVLTTLPPLYLPVSSFLVTPVLAWWHAPHPVYPRQLTEVAHVARLPVAELVDPANRIRVRHPSGWIGAAFQVRGMLVWGFTAGVISTLLDLAGWSRPWDIGRVLELPEATAAVPATPDGAADEVVS